MKMNYRILTVLAACLIVLSLSGRAPAQTTLPKKSEIPAALKSQAKISLEDARRVALQKVPGVVKEEELEKENGKLVYSFDIQAAGQKDTTEVQVSAMDGSILSLEKEDPASEAKEKKQEAPKPKP